MEEINGRKFLKSPAFVVIIILVCGTSFFIGIRDLKESMKQRHQAKTEWTTEDHAILIEKCLQDMKEKAIAEPVLSRLYCDCAQTQLEKNISKKDYLELIKKPFPEQEKTIMPFIRQCLDDYLKQTKQNSIQSIEYKDDTLIVK
jgi:hypothetical protein